jgi:hypothetical protein
MDGNILMMQYKQFTFKKREETNAITGSHCGEYEGDGPLGYCTV